MMHVNLLVKSASGLHNMRCDTMMRFLRRSVPKPSECKGCPRFSLCRGGCPRDWETTDGQTNNYYCRSIRQVLRYAGSRIIELAHVELVTTSRR